MAEDQVYICRKPAYTEERGDRYLMIWPDIPNWVVVDEEAFTFITGIEGEITFQKMKETFHSVADTSDENVMNAVTNNLINAKILYEKGDTPFQFLPGPDKIMNVVVHPTNRCNLRCIMCSRNHILLGPGGDKGELTAEEFKTFLDQVQPFLAEKGARSVVTGGEPLVAPEKTLEIMAYLSQIVESVSLNTNGTLVTAEVAQRISSIENVSVQVSLDSPFREHHERLRGRGTFDRTIAGIRKLVAEGVTTVINMVVHRDNIAHLEEYYELGLQLGVTNARFIPLQQAGAGITCGLEPPYLPHLMDESFSLFKRNPQYRKLIGTDFLFSIARLCRTCAVQNWCGTGTRLVLLNADGEVYPCPNHHLPEFKAGSIREKPFGEIWEHSPVLKKIRSIYPVESINEKCAACPVRHWCAGWCRGETYQVTGSMRAPFIRCDELKQIIIDMFFMLSENNDVFGDLTKDFGKAIDLNQI